MDREKVIKEFEHLLNAAKGNYQDFVDLTVDGGEEILALLKEQKETINDLTNTIRQLNQHIKDLSEYMTPYGKVKDVKAYAELLKEQEEETKFVYDEDSLPTCEKCTFHPFAGYIPTIKWMKERGYMKCPRCGRAVKWG